MKKRMKRGLAAMLALVMCLSMLNLTAFATEGVDVCAKAEDCAAEIHDQDCPMAEPSEDEGDSQDGNACTGDESCTAEVHEEGCSMAEPSEDEEGAQNTGAHEEDASEGEEKNVIADPPEDENMIAETPEAEKPLVSQFEITVNCVNKERGHQSFNNGEIAAVITKSYELQAKDCSLTDNGDSTWTLTVDVARYLSWFNSAAVFYHAPLADTVTTTLYQVDGDWVAADELAVDAVCTPMTDTHNESTQLGVYVKCPESNGRHSMLWREVDRSAFTVNPANVSVEVNSGSAKYPANEYPFCATYTMGLDMQANFVDVYYNYYLTKPDYAAALEHKHMLESDNSEQSVTYYWDKANSSWVRDGEGFFTINVEEEHAAVWVLDESGELLKEFDKLQDGINFAQSGQTVQLWKNVTENVTVKNKNITLDLNKHTVDGGGKNTVLTIDGGNVTLTGNGTITGGANNKHGGGVRVDNNGSFTMFTGTITGNSATEWGGGVCVDYGTFTMEGGVITKNTATNLGGGVAVYNYLQEKSALFIMNGGTISDNSSISGGGVGAYGWKHDSGRVVAELNGGTIEDNDVTGDGGGVAVQTADYYADKTALHTIKLGEVVIDNNTANQGGGLYSIECIVEINGARVTDNVANGSKGYGGGICAVGGTVTLTDIEITGNTGKQGGGIYANHTNRETSVTMTSGKLYGNTAPSAADVYCNKLTTLSLPAASSMNGKLNEKDITGWYWDAGGKYAWSSDYCVERNVTSSKNVQQYLIAAYDLRDFVAKIVETGVEYTTLQAAFNEAESGQTVEVLKSTDGAYLARVRSITLNVPANMTVSAVSGKAYSVAVEGDGAELTITGAGTVQGGTYGVMARKSGKLIVNMDGGAVTGEKYGIYSLSGSTVNVNGSTVTGATAGTYVTGSTLEVSNSELSGRYGIYATGANTNVTVNSGTITGTPKQGIALYKGANATINGTEETTRINGQEAAIFVIGPGGDSTENPTTLTVNGGKIVGYNTGISGNGSVEPGNDSRHTKITVNGGTIQSTGCTGIYHPQVGELTINGGTILGITGVEMRAGTLSIPATSTTVITADYTFNGTYYGYSHMPNASGGTAFGAGIVISQHTTERPITATIGGGTITGYYALVEHDLMSPGHESDGVNLNVTGGVFIAVDKGNAQEDPVAGRVPFGHGASTAVVSDNLKSFITGGYFSNDVSNNNSREYVADTHVSHSVSTVINGRNGYYNVHRPNSVYAYNATNHWTGCNGHADCTYNAGNTAAHTYGAWVVDQAATTQAAGRRHHDCTVCGYRQYESIAQLPGGGGGTGGGGGGTGGGGGGGTGGGTTTIIDPEVPLAGGIQLNRIDHIAYVSGYEDSTVRPLNNITREEVAAMFYRLLADTSRTIYETDSNEFNDVDAARWSNRAISTLANAGIISGYPDGSFRPSQTITRAEFAAIAARFDAVTEGLTNPFSDTAGHWAENLISYAASKGWVSGYPDGTFQPQKAITRAEAMTLVNNVLDREVDEEGLVANVKQWPDNEKGVWYYYEVLEATNSHDYARRTETGLVENWTAVTSG